MDGLGWQARWFNILLACPTTGSTRWSEYADLTIDPLNGDALPASAPLPTAPPSVSVVAADGGAWITWGEADPGPDAQIVRYEVTATTTGGIPTTSTFTANADARSMAVTSLQNGSAYQWSIKAVGSYGSGPSTSGGTAVATPVPNGPANFQSIAQSYLVAKGRLVSGYAVTPQAAADSTEASAAIGDEVNATGNDDISARAYLARSGIAYTSYAVSLGDSVAYWTPDASPPTVTLQVTADETLNQTTDNIAADPELRSVRYTFTFAGSGATWKISQVTQPAEPEDTAPDAEPDAGAPPNETPVPLAMNSDGTFATNPDSTQPQSPSGTLDYYAISNYVHRYYRNYNPAYIRYGNDCTNFASQALYAGGRHMRGGFYTSVGSWYYGGFIKKASWTWGGAKNLFNHLFWTGTFYPKYTSDAAVGDLLFWDDNGDGTISHVSVVVRRIGKTVYYGQHSNDYDNRTIEAGLRASPPGTKVYDFRITG